MNVYLRALNESGMIYFESEVSIDAVNLVEVARERVPFIRAKGREFAEGAAPFFAAEMLDAAKRGDGAGVHQHAIHSVLGFWLAESVFGDLTAADFVRSNLQFSILDGGGMKISRILRSTSSGNAMPE